MKTNLLAVIGGLLLIASTLIPSHGSMMWSLLSIISADLLLGAMPLVIALTGLIGILVGKDKGMIALVCGVIALIWMLAAIRFEFRAFKEILFLIPLIGSLLLIAAGAMGMKKPA